MYTILILRSTVVCYGKKNEQLLYRKSNQAWKSYYSNVAVNHNNSQKNGTRHAADLLRAQTTVPMGVTGRQESFHCPYKIL